MAYIHLLAATTRRHDEEINTDDTFRLFVIGCPLADEPYKKVKENTAMKNIGRWAFIIVVILFIASVGYKVMMRAIANRMLKNDGVNTRGVIIDEKNYLGNSPVSHTFSYSYQFTVEGTVYKNDSYNPDLSIGDSIDVIYVKKWPNLNKPQNLNE